MTISLSSDEQALVTSLTNTPPSGGWPAKCAQSDANKQITIDNRIGSGKLPAAQWYNSGTYSPETATQLFRRLFPTQCTGSLPSGTFTRGNREVELMEAVLADQQSGEGAYAGICGLNGRTILNNNGFSDLPADSSESVGAMLNRLGICNGGQSNANFGQPSIDGRIGNI